MDIGEKEELVVPLATLNSKQTKFLSQIAQDIRKTVSELDLPSVAPLSVLNADAVDGLKDLYYALNSEDPLNAMPVRRHVLERNIPTECLVPIAVAADKDPAATRNRKRWSLPTYQILRLFSVLTLPIASDSELPTPSQLDYLLLDLKFKLAGNRKVLSTFVSLLQYYIDRKTEKKEALAPAEESKVEDARIDNALRFFCNILSPPRVNVGEAISERDRAVHLALVGSLVSVELFSTLAVLFSSEEDSKAHYTDLIFLVADIYALAYRHSSPYQMMNALGRMKLESARKANINVKSENKAASLNVFDDPSLTTYDKETGLKKPKPVRSSNAQGRTSSGLRDALLRERATIGGSRAALVSARWTNRHSGGFVKATKSTEPNSDKSERKKVERLPNGTVASTKHIISAKGAISMNKAFNSKHSLQDSVQVNSDILCTNASAGRRRGGTTKAQFKQQLPTVRHDLQDDGMKGIVLFTSECIDVSFQHFIRELRTRIVEIRERAQADETDVLKNAERAYLRITGSVVGFHREKSGKIYKSNKNESDNHDSDSSLLLHKSDMKAILSRDFKIVKVAWKEIQAAIELESFQMVFGILADTIEQLKEATSRDYERIKQIELGTFTVLEMMKMLQGMAAVVSKEIEEAEEAKLDKLTPRELALNVIEDLFETESFLNAPAELAKMYSSRIYSFQHLRNIVEMVHTFTTILLDEEELSSLNVAKKKRKPRKKKVAEDSDDGLEKENKNRKDTDADYIPVSKDKENDKGTDESSKSAAPKEPSIPAPPHPDEKSSASTANETSTSATTKDGPPVSDPSLSGERTSDTTANAANDVASAKDNPSLPEPTRPDERSSDTTANETSKSTSAKENGEGEEEKALSQIEKMLKADQEDMERKMQEQKKVAASSEALPSQDPTTKPTSAVAQMLKADEEAALEGAPEPKYVQTLDGKNVDETALALIQASKEAEADEEMDFAEELTQVESIGIVRRFASFKAIETLMIPLRAALCEASEVTGKIFPKPEGCDAVMGATVVAKSASVMWSIWKVARALERGALCGQFFSFSTLQFLSVALNVANEKGNVSAKSILAYVADTGKEITDVFYKWLEVNPGLMYDMFLVMDRTYVTTFARKVDRDIVKIKPGSKTKGSDEDDDDEETEKKKGRKRRGKKSKNMDDPYSDGKLPSSPDMWDSDELEGVETTREVRKKRTKKLKVTPRRRRVPRTEGVEEDEDVDDLDELDFGHSNDEDEEDMPPARKDKPAKQKSKPRTKKNETEKKDEIKHPSSPDMWDSDEVEGVDQADEQAENDVPSKKRRATDEQAAPEPSLLQKEDEDDMPLAKKRRTGGQTAAVVESDADSDDQDVVNRLEAERKNLLVDEE